MATDGSSSILLVRAGAGSDFAQLSRQVRAAGLLNRRVGRYCVRIALTVGAYAALWVGVARIGNSWLQMVMAVVLGLATTQVAFLGHDGGHHQIFRSRAANDFFGRVVANLFLGLSFGWWVDKHNRHHAHPNTEDLDPDIGNGALAFTTGQVAARTGGLGRLITAHQAWLFFPMLTLEGLNLHLASVLSLRRGAERSVRGGRRRTELLLLMLHGATYLAALFVIMSPVKVLAFVAIHQAVWGLYMGCSFAPNHKGMPIVRADEPLDFLRRQVLTSRNVRGGAFTDLLLGGLNYQVEHHLFPSMPRSSLRRAHYLVRTHCAHLGIAYTETSLLGSYVAAVRYLHALGAQLRAPVDAVIR